MERKILKRLPIDPCGTPFGYRIRDGSPVITSLGADQLVGGTGDAADLTVP